MDDSIWADAQREEAHFWGMCENTYGEETKQLLYMNRMGFTPFHDGRSPFNFDAKGASIIDIGGGPSSVLLKFRNFSRAVVVDPCRYPSWVYSRYEVSGIEVFRVSGEELIGGRWDIALIYNVLQHTMDPQRVVINARSAAGTLRVFEWIGIPAHPGHPHKLTKDALDEWSGAPGTVETFSGQNECVGQAWYM